MAFDVEGLSKALEHDAARRGQAPEPARPVQELRRLILDAVLLAERADLLLKEADAWALRDDLLKAAHKLKSAATLLLPPNAMSKDKR